MNGLREAIHRLPRPIHGLSKAIHTFREPKFTLRATNRRPPKRNHGPAKSSLCPLEWKNTLKKAMS